MPVYEEAIALHNESVVFDIHCHPSLKVKLFKYDINDSEHKIAANRVKNSPSDEIFQMQYDLPQMNEGGVNSVWSSVYIVEKGLLEHSNLKIGSCVLNLLGFKFSNAVENVFLGGPFLQALKLMEIMEKQILSSENKSIKAKIPKNFDELSSALLNGYKCFIHSLEGAHMLGRNLSATDKYIQNLETFFNRGVCSITLSHFMPNNICSPANGISPNTVKSLGFKYNYSKHAGSGLTYTGSVVVEKMLELGIIIDLTHMTEKGRLEVFDINEKRGAKKRPLTFTHTGIRPNCTNELLTPTTEEIIKIRDCNGVIGVIFMNYWLTGNEGGPDFGISNIVKTVKDIAAICGSYDNIAIGSDMDGFTQPVDDLFCSSQMQKLTAALMEAGISPADIKKVLGLNALRVLQEGWK